MHRLLALCTIAFAAALLATPAAAQSIRDTVAAARLGPGYAQMINLASAPDISAARYDIKGDDANPAIDVARVPWQSKLADLQDGRELWWRVAGSYLRFDLDFSLNSLPQPAGISSRWTAYSATAGIFARLPIGAGFTLEPGIDFGVARLDNDASYSANAALLQPLLDGSLFNWNTAAWLVTPGIALDWNREADGRRIAVRGHVAWSWIASFDESDPVVGFSETAGVYSIRGSYAAPTGGRIADRPVDWVAFVGYAGFVGPNRDALGFTNVAEAGLGIEIPIARNGNRINRARLGASYLFGSDVTGWAVTLGFQY